jgi:hypothetical protein
MTTIAFAAFFGLLALIQVAKNIRYEPTIGQEPIAVKAGQTIVIKADGTYAISNSTGSR